MLLTLLLTLEGTPYIYQGEEIGMPNSGLSNIDDYRDVEVMNHYREAVEAELDLEAVMASYMKMSRDNARTPMQWSSGKNAGFTVGQPWIKPGVSSREVNVEKDLADPESIIKYLRALTVLRKENPVLIYGEYESALAEDSRLYLYRRSLSGDKFLVMLNFSGDEVALYNDESFSLDEADAGELLICNYPVSTGGSLKVLRPFEARVYK
jgi:oligo-1,6-glucosidase